MHLEKFKVDKIQNGRLSAIIHLDRPVGPSVNNSFPEHISESTCPIVFKFYTQHP